MFFIQRSGASTLALKLYINYYYMSRNLLLGVLLFMAAITYSRNLTGRVVDESNNGLEGATVFIHELNEGTVTDKNGNFYFHELPSVRLKLKISFLGYSNSICSVNETESGIADIQMKLTTIEAEEFVVTGGFNGSQHENTVKIDILSIGQESDISTPNIMQILTNIPGVDMISKGNGIGKPVIRGMSMNDVLVLNNGFRFENYQYSSHHTLGIDEFGIDRVEIIKGPASLLYGSDAIGGVINFIRESPAPVNSLEGNYGMNLFSNSTGIEQHINIKATKGKVFAGLNMGYKSHGDYLQGGGKYVPNSRFNDRSVKSNLGWISSWGTSRLFFESNKATIGMVENEAIEKISERGRENQVYYQSLGTDMFSLKNSILISGIKMDLNASYQYSTLAHLDDPEIVHIEMGLGTLNYELKLNVPLQEKGQFIGGFQGFYQTNQNLNNRPVILLPDANANNESVFGMIDYRFNEKFKVQSGIRYDWKTLTYNTLDKHFKSPSGSIGFTWQVNENNLIRSNFASAFRTPNLPELSSDGPHELRHELGNRELVPENAYSGDLSLHMHRENYTFDLGSFYNLVKKFIFIAPAGQYTAEGLPVYLYQQADANLFGGEANFHIHPLSTPWLHLKSGYSMVRGLKLNTSEHLPFVPADKLNIEIGAVKNKWGNFRKVYFKIRMHYAFKQDRPAPEEEPTDSYTLFDFNTGGDFNLWGVKADIQLVVSNLFDLAYIDHLSTLKEVGMLNPGRNISLSLKIPFQADIK